MNVESVEIGTIANCAKGRCRTIGWIDQQRPWKRLHFLSAVPSQSSCKIVPQINKYQKKPIKCSKRFSKTDWTICHCYCNLFLWRIEVSRRCELSGRTAPTVEPFLSLNETVKMTEERRSWNNDWSILFYRMSSIWLIECVIKQNGDYWLHKVNVRIRHGEQQSAAS